MRVLTLASLASLASLARFPVALLCMVALGGGCETTPIPFPGPSDAGRFAACSNAPVCNGSSLPVGCSFGTPFCINGVNTCGRVICPDGGFDEGGADEGGTAGQESGLPADGGLADMATPLAP